MDVLLQFAATADLAGERRLATDLYERLMQDLLEKEEGAWKPEGVRHLGYLRCLYAAATPPGRTRGVLQAIERVEWASAEGWEAVPGDSDIDPLTDYHAFLERWIETLEDVVDDPWVARFAGWPLALAGLLQEAVQVGDGADVLAELASCYGPRAPAIYDAWCDRLLLEHRWDEALEVAETGAATMTDPAPRAHLADRASLLAWWLTEEGRASQALWAAWRASPTVPRLLRLCTPRPGSRKAPARVRELAKALAAALDEVAADALPESVVAAVEVLSGDFRRAADRLASVPPEAWIDYSHPGHLVFASLAVVGSGRRPRSGWALRRLSKRLDADLDWGRSAGRHHLGARSRRRLRGRGAQRRWSLPLTRLLDTLSKHPRLDEDLSWTLLETVDDAARCQAAVLRADRTWGSLARSVDAVLAAAEAWECFGAWDRAGYLLAEITGRLAHDRPFTDELRKRVRCSKLLEWIAPGLE